jgi:PAS domain S-box-containing protein
MRRGKGELVHLSASDSSSTRSLKELASISELNPNPILEWDANGSVAYCNRAADTLFPEIRQQSKDHEFLVGFDSALRILLTVGASIARDVSVGSEWYHQTIHRVEAGSSVRVYAVNITDRKAVEFSRELLSTAVTKSKDWIYITDANGTIGYVNDSVTIECGYSREELIGATPSIWKSGFHGEAFYAELWRDILNSKPFFGIFVNRKKDGTRFSLDQTITPITASTGVITSFAATGRDITQQAELEKRINYLSYYDVLTGLPNRHLFLDRLKRTLLAAERHQKVIAVLVVDLDRFKFANDVQGTEVGDSILRGIAEGLSQAVYERDTRLSIWE